MHRRRHPGLDLGVGTVDSDFDAKDFVFAVVASLYVAGKKLGFGVYLFDMTGELRSGWRVHFDLRLLIEADAA
jgi:hypothetical protein